MNVAIINKISSSLKMIIMSFFLTFLFINNNNATTIVPFTNLGEMAKASDAVVVARVLDNYEMDYQGATRFRTLFTVDDLIKGQVEEEFEIQSLQFEKEELFRQVPGDATFEIGETYLIFLHKASNDYWQPWMLSHAVFKDWLINGESVLAPVNDGLNFQILSRPDGQEVDPMRVYQKEELVNMLKDVLDNGGQWNGLEADSKLPIADFITKEIQIRNSAPTHCNFFFPAPSARWDDFENASLPVRYGAGGDSGCSSWLANTQAAIGEINGAYAGVDLTDSGTHNFTPGCANGSAVGSDFTSYVSSNFGGTRNLLIQYDDPCGQVSELNGCSDVLAIGGLYAFSSTHMHDGIPWRDAAYGYVVMNNGTGACLCGEDYITVLIHEMTHSLSIDHISAATGTANMNPSCCNDIQGLDIECLNYLYPPEALPVELVRFDLKNVLESQIDLYWSTASELNNDYFQPERSADGINFEAIGKVTGIGTSSTLNNYEYSDKAPLDGTNYYRLKQIDFDGTFSYSDMKVIHFGEKEISINIFPNPIRNNVLSIQTDALRNGEVAIEILNVAGEQIRFFNNNITSGQSQIDINIPALQGGVYFVRVTNDKGFVQTNKFVKM